MAGLNDLDITNSATGYVIIVTTDNVISDVITDGLNR